MSTKIRVTNNVTGADTEVQGSPFGRMNVSSQSDTREYYASRESGLAFSLFFEMTLCGTGEFAAYWRNASPDKALVITAVRIGMGEPARAKLHFVTGVASGGTELTPLNLNKSSSKAAPDDAVVMAMEGNTTTPISGLTSVGVIDVVGVSAASEHVEMKLNGQVRLGQGDAIAIEGEDIATTTPLYGTIFGYYE